MTMQKGQTPHNPLSGNAEGIVPRTSQSRKNKCLHPSTGLQLRPGDRTAAGGKCFQPCSPRGTNAVQGRDAQMDKAPTAALCIET